MGEPDVSALLSVSQAIEIIDSTPVTPRVQSIDLADAHGLVLAQDILTDRDSPPFDKSLMDGYAVRARDVASERAALRCVGEIAAGAIEIKPIQPGETAAIMTGAPMPQGADAVIPVENRISIDGNIVHLAGPAMAGRYIARRGAEVSAGQLVLRKGTHLESAQLAVAASVGAATLMVYARPRVAVLTTGDELVPFDQTPQGSQIRNSNGIMLFALLKRLGCDVTDLGMVRDDPGLIRDAIGGGLKHDILVVSGGMSMGEHDYVPGLLREMGVDLKITKLRIKPGKPFVFGIAANGGFVFGLPGNPVSGFVCTLRLCSRLVARLRGAQPAEKRVQATIETGLEANGPREFYQPAVLSPQRTARPLQWKGSADVYTLSEANCLIVRGENAPPLVAGSAVDVLEIPL